jgi:hypothetical protein
MRKSKYSEQDHRDLEENPRLKQMYADLSLENRPLKDVIAKTGPKLGRVTRWLRAY